MSEVKFNHEAGEFDQAIGVNLEALQEKFNNAIDKFNAEFGRQSESVEYLFENFSQLELATLVFLELRQSSISEPSDFLKALLTGEGGEA